MDHVQGGEASDPIRRRRKRLIRAPRERERCRAYACTDAHRSTTVAISALRSGDDPWQGLVEILPHMSYELAIRGMIGRLDADDNGIQRGHMLLHVP